MFRKIGVIFLVLLVFVVMIWFTSLNPGVVAIDLAFGTVEPTLSLALAITFVLGWAFGILSLSMYVLRLLNERRRLRSQLRDSVSEVESLRSLPIADAD